MGTPGQPLEYAAYVLEEVTMPGRLLWTDDLDELFLAPGHRDPLTGVTGAS